MNVRNAIFKTACAALAFSALTACGAKRSDESYNGASGGYAYPEEAKEFERWESSYDMDYSYALADEVAPIAKPSAGGDSGAGTLVEDVEQKIIKTANVSLNVKDYSNAFDELKAAVDAAGGYIENSNSYVYMTRANREFKSGSVTVRVPSGRFDEIKRRISDLGKVTRDNESSDNVTSQYYDIEKRLTAKQEEEKRLLELIGKAEKIEDLIRLEERLSYVRAEIETYRTRMSNIDRLASFSTINVDMRETPDEEIEPISDDLWQLIKNAFIGSVNDLKEFFEWLAVFAAGALLPLMFIGALAAVIVFLIKGQKRRIDRKYAVKENKKEGDSENA